MRDSEVDKITVACLQEGKFQEEDGIGQDPWWVLELG